MRFSLGGGWRYEPLPPLFFGEGVSMKYLRAINWPMITAESIGFFFGLFIGVTAGFMMGYCYVLFPWGVP